MWPMIFAYGPAVVAGMMATVVGLQCRRALTAFLTTFVLSVLLAVAFGSGLGYLFGVPVANFARVPMDVVCGGIAGFVLGMLVASFVGNRAPPSIRN